MTIWLKENILPLIVACATGVGVYTVGVNRVAVLEVKVEHHQTLASKTECVIEVNTKALGEVMVLLAKVDGRFDMFGFRLDALELSEHKNGKDTLPRRKSEQRVAGADF